MHCKTTLAALVATVAAMFLVACGTPAPVKRDDPLCAASSAGRSDEHYRLCVEVTQAKSSDGAQ